MQLRDVGVLVSIFHRSSGQDWLNLARSMRIIRPVWSSLAIDGWGVETSQQAMRQRIYSQHTAVLSLFSRVLFLATGPRSHVQHHVRSSGSYKLHWLATFASARINFVEARPGAIMEYLPALLMGLDADTVVPPQLPVEAYHSILDAGAHLLDLKGLESRRRAAEQDWIGSAQGCRPVGPKQCEVSATPSRLVYIHPIVHREVDVLHRYAEQAQAQLNLQGRSNCCDYARHRVPKLFKQKLRSARSAHSFIRRGPHCPPTSFWILHRRDLPLMLDTLRVWHKAMLANTDNQSNPLMRLEFLGCSLLASHEGVLIDVYQPHNDTHHDQSELGASG